MAYMLKNIKVSPFTPTVTELRVTSDFGYREFKNTVTGKKESGNHSGIDVTNGSTIVAIADGTVTAVRDSVKGYDESKTSGNYVTISHGNKTYSTYCHMALGSIKVKVGDKVKKGQVLGTTGKTGKATGVHLHLGIQYNGSKVDPKPYLLGEKLIGSTTTSSNTSTTTSNTNSKIKYKVVKGDNLSKIAKKHNTTWNKIYNDNKELIDSQAKKHGIKSHYENYLYPGQVLIINK